jgi:hypothetical protein
LVSPSIHFEPDTKPVVTQVDFSRRNNVTDDELECLEQTFFGMDVEVAEVFKKAEPWVYTPRFSVGFSKDGRARVRGVNRGPAYHLFFADADSSRTKLLSCVPGLAQIDVELTFDEQTGGVSAATALAPNDTSRVKSCVSKVLLTALPKGRSFEAVVPEDAKLRCTFTASGSKPYTCKRLGADGGYIKVSTKKYLAPKKSASRTSK